MTNTVIPLHDFSADDPSSVPFRLIPMGSRSGYDTSVAHRHNYYEIFLFNNGGGKHHLDFESHDITSKSVQFISPGQVHLVHRAPDSNGHIILFSREFYYTDVYDRNLLFDMPFLNNNSRKPVIQLENTDYEKLSSLIEMMYEEEKNAKEYQQQALRSLLNLFLVHCKRLFKHGSETDQATSELYAFRSLLEQNFRHWHKVQDYANALKISEKQLSEMVKKSTGQNVLEMIHGRILLEAKRLLIHNELSAKEIGYFLNFEDPSHFIKFFKKGTGTTPLAFREEARKKYHER
jgi:AraC-like DNA-binding protein